MNNHNNGASNHGSNHGNNRGNGRRSVSMTMEFYEPVAANAAIFVALIVLDLFNKTNSLIPVHSIAGILITLATLALCRYNYLGAAWAFAIIPALFLIVSFLMAASKNKYVIDAENSIASAYNTAAADVKYGYNTAAADLSYAGDQVQKGYNVVASDVDYIADQAQKDVNYLNTAGTNTYTSASQTLKNTGSSISNLFGISQDPQSISDAWLKAYGAAMKAGLSSASAAVAATAVVGSAPPDGTAAAAVAANLGSSTNQVTISGEFVYLCGDGSKTSIPGTGLADSCKYITQACLNSSDAACADTLAGVLSAPAVCLGSLATGGTPPSSSARDNCLACDPSLAPVDLNACRCAAMGNCPSSTSEKFANYASAF